MDQVKRPSQEDINQQIDSELDKSSDLILDNIKIAPIIEKLGQHDSLKKHLERGQWLNDDQLRVLNLDPETEKSYSELREFYQKQETMTDDERLLEHLENKNKVIESRNEAEKEAYFKELAYVKSRTAEEILIKLVKVFDKFENSYVLLREFTENLKDSVNNEDVEAELEALLYNMSLGGRHFDQNDLPERLVELYFMTKSSFETINQSLDGLIHSANEQLDYHNLILKENSLLEKKSALAGNKGLAKLKHSAIKAWKNFWTGFGI